MKLFLTVGSMLPFDRMVLAVDAWAARHPGSEVFAQIGRGARRPQHFEAVEMLTPDDYRRRLAWADLVVSHVGMGTVIAAAELQRPLLLMPREVARGEVTSDHQQATARWLAGRPGLEIVAGEQELLAALERPRNFGAPAMLAPVAPRLLDALKRFADEALAARR